MHACSTSSASPTRIVSPLGIAEEQQETSAPLTSDGTCDNANDPPQQHHQSSLTRHRTEIILPVKRKPFHSHDRCASANCSDREQRQSTTEEVADALLTLSRTRTALPLLPNALFDFKSASAPNSPITRVRRFGTQLGGSDNTNSSNSQTTSLSYHVDDYQVGRCTRSPVYYARARHSSLCSGLRPQVKFALQQGPLPQSIPEDSSSTRSSSNSSIQLAFSPTNGSTSVAKVCTAGSAFDRLFPATPLFPPLLPILKPFEAINFHNSLHESLINMSYFNRQMSTPIGAPMQERQALQIPPRPSTASPTTPNRSLLMPHRESPNNNAVTPPPRPLTSVSTVIHRRNSGMASGAPPSMDNYFSGERHCLTFKRARRHLLS